ncbi:TPA: hypothetical protein DCX15_04270, partial [bacterium]|nr:hypothetical protein [bacterium]
SERIHPTFGAAVKMTDSFDCDLLPSIDLIDGFTKYFDDRLLAAIEEYIHIGSSIFPGGKQGFLKVLLRKVLDQRDSPGRDMAAGYLAAAIELGGDKPEVPETIKKIAKSYLNTFMNDPCHSRPMGFYTKSETLEKVFYRDRFLQKPFGTEFWTDLALKEDLPPGREGLSPVIRMAEALLDDPDFRDAYTRFRTLKERLTNPEVNLNLEDLFPHQDLFKDEAKLSQALLSSEASKRRVQARGNINPNTFGVAVWPFSTSKENDLFARLYRTYELPKTEIMNDLIVAIKEGRVDLKPQPDSGWYDHQLYSLETLLLPHLAHEKDKLLLHARYKKRLREAFEAMLTKRRETHVKELFQIRTLGIEFKPVPTTPELSLEPIATHYLRTGRAYRSLAEDLRGVFGDRGITDIQLEDFDKGLLVELDRMASLFYGLYLVVCDDLGMAPRLEPKEIEGLSGLQEVRVDDGALNQCLIASIPELSKTEQQARFYLWQEAKTWIEDLKREKFLDEDTRFIAPVLSNYWGTKVRNWAVLGVRLLKIKAYYARPPKVAESRTYSDEEQISEDPERFPSESFDSKDFDWRPKEYVIPVQVFAEVTMGPKPLTREEFRRICDRYKTKDKILKALMGVSGDQNGSPLPLILGTFILILMLIIFIIRRCFVLRQPKD